MKTLPSAAMAALCLSSFAMSQDPKETRLKIRRIVLYKHGVGYFERQGSVTGSATVPLTFKSEQMKDVLKSLYAVDLTGGRIGSILYDGKDPVTKQLDEILFKVPEGNALTQFLKQLKGARVKIELGGTSRTGTVLGVEPVQRQSEHGVVTTYKLVIFNEAGGIEPV